MLQCTHESLASCNRSFSLAQRASKNARARESVGSSSFINSVAASEDSRRGWEGDWGEVSAADSASLFRYDYGCDAWGSWFLLFRCD